jgi:hypothetical protein
MDRAVRWRCRPGFPGGQVSAEHEPAGVLQRRASDLRPELATPFSDQLSVSEMNGKPIWKHYTRFRVTGAEDLEILFVQSAQGGQRRVAFGRRKPCDRIARAGPIASCRNRKSAQVGSSASDCTFCFTSRAVSQLLTLRRLRVVRYCARQ